MRSVSTGKRIARALVLAVVLLAPKSAALADDGVLGTPIFDVVLGWILESRFSVPGG